ncbi:BatD family protein [Fibrobacterota bacterium]
MKNFFCSLLATASLAALVIPGWSMQAEANISAQEVGVGETLVLTVTITEQKQIKDLPWPQIQGNLDAFTMTKNSGTSSSAQTTIVNGRISKQTNYVTQFTYNLTAKKPGSFVIGPISYAYQKFRKNLGSAKVTVVKTEPGIRLITTLSKKSVYMGEQVRYNLRIVPKPSVQNIQAPNFQKQIGQKFFMKQLDDEIKARTATVDGQQKRVFDIRFALFPLLAGDVTLAGFPLEYEELARRRGRSRSIFDMFESDFFGGSKVKKQAETKAVSLHVLSLPPGKPQGFSGAVGQYKIKVSTDKTSLPSGEAFSLFIEISGNGQPKAITRPLLPDLDNFEVFDPETKSQTKVSGGALLSYKSFKYVLVPTRKGDYSIGAVKFPYFDPKAKSYKTAASAPISINVTQGREMESRSRILTQREIEEIGSDIRHIKKSLIPMVKTSRFIYKAPWFWGLFPVPPLVFFVLLLYRNRTRKLGEDAGLRRKVHAKGIARKRLSEARKALQGDDSRTYYRSLARAVERFISDKLNMEFRGITLELAMETLQEKGLTESIRTSYKSFMELCDAGQFARSEKNPEVWNKAYGEAENLINRLNKVL